MTGSTSAPAVRRVAPGRSRSRRVATTGVLLRARASEQRGLLVAAGGTIAAAVATFGFVLAQTTAGATEAAAADSASGGAGAAALVAARPSLFVTIVVAGALAVTQLSVSIAHARAHERETLVARGLSRRQIIAVAGLEALAVSLGGLATGSLTLLVLCAAASIPPPTGDGGVWLVALALLLGAAFAFISSRRVGATRPGTRRAATVLALLVVAGAVALVAWQLPQARPGTVDPVVVVAPSVLVVGSAVAALFVFRLGAAFAAGLGAAGTGASWFYATRQVARRGPVFAAAVIVVAVASSQVVSAAVFSATWTTLVASSAEARSGAPVRVDTAPRSVSPQTLEQIAMTDGVAAAAPALLQDVAIGPLEARMIALPRASVTAVVSDAGGAVDVGRLAAAPMAGAFHGQPIPIAETVGALTIRATAEFEAMTPTLVLSAVLIDNHGTPTTLSFPATADDDATDGRLRIERTTALPAGEGPWALLALTVSQPTSFSSAPVSVTVDGVAAAGELVADIAGAGRVQGTGSSATLWVAGMNGEAAPPVPAIVSSSLASSLGASEGDVIEFQYAGAGRRGEAVVTAIAPVLPSTGTAPALVVDLTEITVSQLQRGSSIVSPDSVWVAVSSDLADVASLLGADLPGATVASAETDAATQVLSGLIPAWQSTTVGVGVLAVIAAFAISRALASSRRREIGVMRALGVSPGAQARARSGELAAVFGAAAVLGGIVSAVATAVLAPALVRASTFGIIEAASPARVDGLALLVNGGLIALGLAAVVIDVYFRTNRTARSAVVDEDSR